MTRIIFDNRGRPHWIAVPESGAYLHNIDTYRKEAAMVDTTPPFTEADMDWFRRPVQDA